MSAPAQSHNPSRVHATSVERASERGSSIPWPIWASFVATACSIFGLYWDISWHMSIGRDSFWTPAHLVIQSGAVLAGLSCGFLILHTTLRGSPAEKAATVNVWGFRGPLGAFIIAWGGFAMITSAPFDNWWHDAYGLDVKIVSPPHTVLLFGLIGIQVGSLVLVRGAISRAAGALKNKLETLFFLIAGLVLIQMQMFTLEYIDWPEQHSARCYMVVSMVVPLILIASARSVRRRWACTTVAAVYSMFWLAMEWIFPLFPAAPKLGPIYHQVTHMLPLGFPLLLIVPAVVLDLIYPRVERLGLWSQSLVFGALFFATFLLVQWPFASFLVTPASSNWIFGTHYVMFSMPPEAASSQHRLALIEPTAALFWQRMVFAVVAAIVSTRVGMAWGAWMGRIKR